METPESVREMQRLHALGVGTRGIAEQVGCSRNTVRRYIRQGGWRPYARPHGRSKLDGLGPWLTAALRQHRGNADVVRQELWRQHGIAVSLRTVERAVAPARREMAAERTATTRFETLPGQQLQIDFGSARVEIAGVFQRVHLFVATLGYSRRIYVGVFRSERQAAWLDGLEGAFHHFGGVPAEVLLDNARALVTHHDPASGEVVFNERLMAFARHWNFQPRACRPCRARTKGKDENGVGYVKRNALAGHAFASWSSLEAHLSWWMREIADARVHATTGERPADRFERAERDALRGLGGRASFQEVREVTRRVRRDCSIELATNAYSVPWWLIGERVRVRAEAGTVTIHHGRREVARHRVCRGERERVVDPAHFAGLTADSGAASADPPGARSDEAAGELVRPLAAYAAVIEEVAS